MIAYAMLYTVAVGVPLFLAALSLSAVLRRHGRPERLVWLGALVLSFALPIIMLLRPVGGGPSAVDDAATRTGAIGLPEVIVVPDGGAGIGLGDVLVAAWLLASVLLAVRWLLASLRLRKASRSWRRESLDGAAVWMTEDLGPAVCGVFRPRVLVAPWLHALSTSERSLILQHEQEHIRAHDPLLIALARTARVLTPWNPVVWLLTFRLVRAVELDCDRRVLRRSPDVGAYGRTLLNVSARRPRGLVAAAAFAESHAPLRSRILAMTTPSRTVSMVALLSATVFGAILLVGALQVPVPTVSIQVQFSPRAPDAPSATVPAGGSAGSRAGAPSSETGATDWRRSATEETPPSTTETLLRNQADPDLSAQPTFTPYTVAPQILNRDEVVRTMTEQYPALLRDAAIGGTVRVYFFIDRDGIVRDTRLDRSSGFEPLDRAALAVAGVYRFSPALNGDEPVPVWVSFPITFQVR